MRGRLIIGLALLSVLVAAGCTGDDEPGAAPTRGTLARFASANEFEAYFDDLAVDAVGRVEKSVSNDAMAAPATDSADAAGAPPTTVGDASITNNQELGVDEGDIVKRMGDSLIVLRQGRLYAVDISAPGHPRQTDGVDVAPDPALNQDVWYDEALVHDDRVYVIGYRYSVALSGAADQSWSGATEITSFRVVGGRFERLASTFVESYDYFSGSNYASRLVDDHLVMYQVNGAWAGWDGERRPQPQVPRFLSWNAATQRFDAGAPTFTPTDVYRPIEAPEYPVFHAAMRCSLPDDGGLTCTTRALLGDGGSEHYVSSSRVYLWTDDLVYAITLSDQTASAHSAKGYPADQFAFAERNDTLHVIVSDDESNVSRLSLSLAAFDDQGRQSLDGLSQPLGEGWVTAQRWVGDTALVAISESVEDDAMIKPLAEDADDAASSSSNLEPYRDLEHHSLLAATIGSEPVRRDTAAPVSRIEALDSGRALTVAADETGTTVDVIDAPSAAVIGSTRIDGSREAESRSHAFSFNGTDLLGLPVLGPTVDWDRGGASYVMFFALNPDGALAPAGAVNSSGVPTHCTTSCTDWYGNTRPIFTAGRVFALMGSELVEANVSGRPPTITAGGRVALG